MIFFNIIVPVFFVDFNEKVCCPRSRQLASNLIGSKYGAILLDLQIGVILRLTEQSRARFRRTVS